MVLNLVHVPKQKRHTQCSNRSSVTCAAFAICHFCALQNQYNLLFYNTQYDCFCRSTSVNTVFQLICQRAGIQNEGGSHVLRHTFATRCIEAGVGPETLRTWLGHKDVSTTINTYINVFQKHQDKQMQKSWTLTKMSSLT